MKREHIGIHGWITKMSLTTTRKKKETKEKYNILTQHSHKLTLKRKGDAMVKQTY